MNYPIKKSVSFSCPQSPILSQNFNVAEQFTGLPGSYVPVEETVKGFREILEGKYDDLPEEAFRSVGRIEDVVEKAKTLGY